MDIRKIILDELERQGRSKYWLAENPGCGTHKNAIYAYLRGESDSSGQNIAAMLNALNLSIVPGRTTVGSTKGGEVPAKRKGGKRLKGSK